MLELLGKLYCGVLNRLQDCTAGLHLGAVKSPAVSASFISGTPIEYNKHKHRTGLFTFSPPDATTVMFLPHEVREYNLLKDTKL